MRILLLPHIDDVHVFAQVQDSIYSSVHRALLMSGDVTTLLHLPLVVGTRIRAALYCISRTQTDLLWLPVSYMQSLQKTTKWFPSLHQCISVWLNLCDAWPLYAK